MLIFMRKFIGILIILLPITVFSQKVVNGFGVEVFLGRSYTSPDNMNFKYRGIEHDCHMTGESDVFGGTAYFPFDFGVKRNRITIAPGLEYRSCMLSLEPKEGDNIIGSDGSIKEGLGLKLISYTPLVQVLYRPHFYLGPIHMSFSVGANFKYIVYKTLEICDKENLTLVGYNKNGTAADDEYINFMDNTSAMRLRDINFHIDPRLGFDFYIQNSFMISLFAIVPDVQSVISTKSVKLELGAGVTYLIRTNKITEAKILQQYKK